MSIYKKFNNYRYKNNAELNNYPVKSGNLSVELFLTVLLSSFVGIFVNLTINAPNIESLIFGIIFSIIFIIIIIYNSWKNIYIPMKYYEEKVGSTHFGDKYIERIKE